MIEKHPPSDPGEGRGETEDDYQKAHIKHLERLVMEFARLFPNRFEGDSVLAHAREVASSGGDQGVREAWQPIETAPKDGTRVLLFTIVTDGRVVSGPTPFAWIDSWWIGDALNGPRWQGSHYGNPTHWMPLPAPPGLLTPPVEPDTK